jgi:hypothetical protein
LRVGGSWPRPVLADCHQQPEIKDSREREGVRRQGLRVASSPRRRPLGASLAGCWARRRYPAMAPRQQVTLAPSSRAAHDGRWLNAAGLCRCEGVVIFLPNLRVDRGPSGPPCSSAPEYRKEKQGFRFIWRPSP